jgi:hypothetical protein
MEREEDLCYSCLSPPQIKLQGHLCRQPMVLRGTTSSLKELHLRIRKWRTQTLEVNNRAKLKSHRIDKAEFDHREWRVRSSVG